MFSSAAWVHSCQETWAASRAGRYAWMQIDGGPLLLLLDEEIRWPSGYTNRLSPHGFKISHVICYWPCDRNLYLSS